jgi:CubicO group peptidase (beta-lactamase class C family)
MREVSHHESEADQSRMSKVYAQRDGEWQVRWSPGDAGSYPIVRASGGMISTALDYAVFLQTWLNGGSFGDARILSGDSVLQGTSIQSPTDSYGFGWRIGPDGDFSHGGSDGTFAWADPARKLIGLLFTQSPGSDHPRNEFRRLVTEALRDSEPAGAIAD